MSGEHCARMLLKVEASPTSRMFSSVFILSVSRSNRVGFSSELFSISEKHLHRSLEQSSLGPGGATGVLTSVKSLRTETALEQSTKGMRVANVEINWKGAVSLTMHFLMSLGSMPGRQLLSRGRTWEGPSGK
ncbi:unnamed protein product [Ixodes persulcatus]